MAYNRSFAKTKSYAKKRTYKRKAYRQSLTNRRTLMAMIKKSVIKKAEPKERVASFAKTNLYHNCFYNVTGTSSGFICLANGTTVLPGQGTGDNQRIGDQIYASGFTFRMLIGQQADRPNVTFRYNIFGVPKGSGIVYGDWFRNATGNVLLDEPNRDFVKVYKTGTWRPNEAGLGGTGGDEYTFVKKLWFPYKKLIKFGPADAVVTHNDQDLYFSLMAYDAYGTVVTDIVAYVQLQVSFHYRDP